MQMCIFHYMDVRHSGHLYRNCFLQLYRKISDQGWSDSPSSALFTIQTNYLPLMLMNFKEQTQKRRGGTVLFFTTSIRFKTFFFTILSPLVTMDTEHLKNQFKLNRQYFHYLMIYGNAENCSHRLPKIILCSSSRDPREVCCEPPRSCNGRTAVKVLL